MTSSEDHPYVVNFTEGTMAEKKQLSLKGAGLCEMTKLELPVPEGFILSTTAWNDWKLNGHTIPDSLTEAYEAAIRKLERTTGHVFSNEPHRHQPLLLSVRCGSAVPMPGLMNSVLNIGLNEHIVNRLVEDGSERYAYDTYRRFLQSYGCTVEEKDPALYEEIIQTVKNREEAKYIHQVTIEGLQEIVREFRELCDPPENPWDQLAEALQVLFGVWESHGCIAYREKHHSIPDDLGVAVIIQRMVHGNFNWNSGCGVCFSRHINRGGEIFGEFLSLGEGDEVASGHRHTDTVQDLRANKPDCYADLLMCMRVLDDRYGEDIQYVEFTVEDGKLYLLETSAVKIRPRKDGNRYTVVLHADSLQHA